MGVFGYVKDLVTVATIVGLLIVGLAIALKSGQVAVGPERSKRLLTNLSQVVLTLAGCLVALGMIQRMIGFRLTTDW